MRDAFNQFLPLQPSDLNGVVLDTGFSTVTTHVSSNGYYGYQPVQEKQTAQESMDCQDNDTDIQFHNYIEPEPLVDCQTNKTNEDKTERRQSNKKRMWDFEMTERDFKKRREEEPIPIIPVPQAPTTKHANLRCPTHHIPDLPHRIMGHFV